MSQIKTVLICRPNVRLGNTLMLTPLLGEIKQRLPNARVDILTACQDAPRHMAQYPVFLFRRAMRYSGLRDYPQMNLLMRPAELSWAYRKLMQLLPFSEPGAAIVGVFTQATGNKQLPSGFWQLLAKNLQARQTNLRILEIVAARLCAIIKDSGMANATYRQLPVGNVLADAG